MKKKMAFVDVTNYQDWPMGGMLEYERAILKHLVKEYDVDVWGVSVNGSVNEVLEIDGKEYRINIFGSSKTDARIIPNYWRGLGLLNCKDFVSKKYDIVYAHTGSCLVAVQRIVDRSTTKLVYHQHGLSHRTNYSFISLIQRPGLILAQRAADLVFVVSDKESVQSYAKEMKEKTKATFVSIGSPLDLNEFNEKSILERIESRKNTNAENFIYTGRLDPWKGVKTLVLAMEKYVKSVNDKAVLKIVGAGREYKEIQQMIYERELEKSIKLLGIVEHKKIFSLLQEADMFLLASQGEGVSVSVIEAYAAGLPVICFKVAGLEKQVIDGVTGIHAQNMNTECFYEAICKANALKTKISYNCLEEAKKYDSRTVTNKIIREINGLF